MPVKLVAGKMESAEKQRKNPGKGVMRYGMMRLIIATRQEQPRKLTDRNQLKKEAKQVK